MDFGFKHSKIFTVALEETSESGKMLLYDLCNRMETVATEHASDLGLSYSVMSANGVSWVLAKMYIEIDRCPEKGEKLTLCTWPVSVNKAQFRRDFQLFDESRALIARAISQWVIISLSTHRIVRIPEFVTNAALTNAELSMTEPEWGTKGQDSAPVLYETTAKDNDIDLNNHVNNVRYVRWVYKSLPVSLQEKITSFEILYKNEARLGDRLKARGGPDERNYYGISLYNDENGIELVRTAIKFA